MDPLHRYLERLKKEFLRMPRYAEKLIAAFQSSCSAPEDSKRGTFPQFRFSPRGSFDCISLLLMCSLQQPWFTDSLWQLCAEMAYRGNYNGEWAIVQVILEESPHFETVYSKICQFYSEDDIYGNMVPQAVKLLVTCKYKEIDPSKRTPGMRVRPKVYRRGYDDKGTLRQPHQYHGIPGRLQSQPRPDGRNLSGHPLSSFDSKEGCLDVASFREFIKDKIEELQLKKGRKENEPRN